MNTYVEVAIEEYLNNNLKGVIIDRDEMLEDVEWLLMQRLEDDGATDTFLGDMYRDYMYHHRADVNEVLRKHSATLNKEIRPYEV